MMKKKSGFTLAEVLTTLMVIGVVAAMTIPTLMNSTDDQQNKVAYKKAMSVLSQGIQMLTAQENECYEELSAATSGNDKAKGLAACMSSIMSGSLNGDEITTLDGMVYKFYVDTTKTDATTLEELCGQTPVNTVDGWKGGKACGVIVDTNGQAKGTKDFGTVTFSATGFDGQTSQKDLLTLTLSANGVRPTYFDGSDYNRGYEYMYGSKADDAKKPYEGVKMCYKCDGGTLESKQIQDYADCQDGWQTTPPTCTKESN